MTTLREFKTEDDFIFRSKCIQYLERAEKLKTYINGKKKKPVAADGGSGKSAKNGKKGDKKDGSKDSGESVS